MSKPRNTVANQSPSEISQAELEPIYHPTEHDESDDLEDTKRLEEGYSFDYKHGSFRPTHLHGTGKNYRDKHGGK